MPGDKQPSDRPFYVGYLPLPRAHALFLKIALPIAVAGLVIGALGISRSQPAWGDAVWRTGDASRWEGTLLLDPYPMLLVAEDGAEAEAYLLVEMGKFGTQSRFADLDLDGAAVSIRGRELSRDGRRMIELDPDHPRLGPPVSMLVSDMPAVRATMIKQDGRVTLRGEIVDSKCYLGAMKPGAGRGHKACATLCISGGVPPVLVSRDTDGDAVYHLLTDADGMGLTDADLERLKPVIGETIVLNGRHARLGSWRVLMLDDPRRLGGVRGQISP